MICVFKRESERGAGKRGDGGGPYLAYPTPADERRHLVLLPSLYGRGIAVDRVEVIEANVTTEVSRRESEGKNGVT